MRVRGFLFTFRCFSSELWVKAERVIWFACCRFKWGLELSPVEFLHRYKLKKSKQHCGLFEVCEHMSNWSQDPFQVSPLPIPLQPGPAKSILLALKHSHQAISAHTARTGRLPRHTHTNTVGMAKTDGQHSPSQPFVRCEFATQAGELFMCVYVRNE